MLAAKENQGEHLAGIVLQLIYVYGISIVAKSVWNNYIANFKLRNRIVKKNGYQVVATNI